MVDRAVLNIWYVNIDNPASILETEPKADRGYGRKFLAQLNPLFLSPLSGNFRSIALRKQMITSFISAATPASPWSRQSFTLKTTSRCC